MNDSLGQSELPQTKSDQTQAEQDALQGDSRHMDRSESGSVPWEPRTNSSGKAGVGSPVRDSGIVPGGPVKPMQGIFSFLLSLLFHLLILVGLILIYQWSPRPGSQLGTRDTDSVGIVFSTQQGYDQPGGGSRGTAAEADQLLEPPSEAASQVTEAFLPSQNRIGMGATATETSTASGESSTTSQSSGTGTGTGIGKGQGSGSGNGQSVGFSDLRGNGRRFVYILDRSESMKWPDGHPMNYALRETKASIASLDARKGAARFQLVYFNHDAVVFENGRLLEVTAPNKDRVIRFLDSLYPDGGTDPLAAIEKAISLKPDVIFFLTDADEEIPMFNLERIRAVRQTSGVRQIHVVEFGKKTNVQKSSFRQLAAENNGQYIFKDIAELR